MSADSQQIALDVYREILDDPGFANAASYDFERAGGHGKITVGQFADAVLPKLIYGKTEPAQAFVPPMDVWIKQLRNGYRDINIPGPYEGFARLAAPDTSLDAYLEYLDAFSTDVRESTTRNGAFRLFIPAIERATALEPAYATGFVALGHTILGSILRQEAGPGKIISSKRLPVKSNTHLDVVLAEESLDRRAGKERLDFLAKVASQFGHTLKPQGPSKHARIIASDPLQDTMFVIDRIETERISLPEAIDNTVKTLQATEIPLDVGMSERVLTLVAKSLKLADHPEQPAFRYRVFTPGMLDRLTDLFKSLDQEVFSEKSRGLAAIQSALERKAANGDISSHQLDVFWCNFIDPARQ